jgi:hypothetical protein
LGLLASVAPMRVNAQATGSTPQAAVIQTLLVHRTAWMKDSTKVDACSVERALPSPSDFPASIEPRLRRLLTGTENVCNAPQADLGDTVSRRPRWGDIVRIDSLSVADSSAMVFVHVVHGEYHHSESYALARTRGGGWWVREVRQWGFVQSYYAPRRPGGRQ